MSATTPNSLQLSMQGVTQKYSDVKVSLFASDNETMLKLLNFQGELALEEGYDMPHRMSPESMAKGIAAGILIDKGVYLDEIRRIAADPPLDCMINGYFARRTTR